MSGNSDAWQHLHSSNVEGILDFRHDFTCIFCKLTMKAQVLNQTLQIFNLVLLMKHKMSSYFLIIDHINFIYFLHATENLLYCTKQKYKFFKPPVLAHFNSEVKKKAWMVNHFCQTTHLSDRNKCVHFYQHMSGAEIQYKTRFKCLLFSASSYNIFHHS